LKNGANIINQAIKKWLQPSPPENIKDLQAYDFPGIGG